MYIAFPDDRCMSCELPTIKPLCWPAVSSEMELWSPSRSILSPCAETWVSVCNSCAYNFQQAVIFPNREIIALQAAKGTQVCQAWIGWACSALWYKICSFLHGLCVFLLWPSLSQGANPSRESKDTRQQSWNKMFHSGIWGRMPMCCAFFFPVKITLDKECKSWEITLEMPVPLW